MPQDKSRCERFREWIGTPASYIYLNYFLSSWGDRMWHFAVALYLVHLADQSLRLAAIFGFSSAGAVLILGGIIGNWVDNNGRLKVVRISLFLQNMLVALCAVIICLVLFYEDQVVAMWNSGILWAAEAAIVVIAVLAQLASVAYKIAIEKDWIVVVAAKDPSKLANLNATSRSIDLSCKLLAPTATGLIMAATSLKFSAMVIAGWNIVSVFVEYGLLSKVYRMVPRLAVKEPPVDEEEGAEEKSKMLVEMVPVVTLEKEELEDDTLSPLTEKDKSNASSTSEHSPPPDSSTSLKEETPKAEETAAGQKKKIKENRSCFQVAFEPFIVLVGGWRTYAKQKVVFAGMSLSCLYMTVMGFDSITLGYIYAQGVGELIVGIAMALAGLTGIIGTFAFTRTRKRVGLERTGLFAFVIEVGFLSLSVASVFLPGSPFAPQVGYKDIVCFSNNTEATPVLPIAQSTPGIYSNQNNTEGLERIERSIHLNSYHDSHQHHEQLAFVNSPSMLNSMGTMTGHLSRSKRSIPDEADDAFLSEKLLEEEDVESCYHYDGLNISIILFITGIVASRIGLWMADLVVTQLIQENVVELERGVVNGVQNSLNMLMDLLKFTLVIMVPQIHLFGFLIMASFLFIIAAGCFFAFHSFRVRGHLFHFNRIFGCPCCTDISVKNAQLNGKHAADVTKV